MFVYACVHVLSPDVNGQAASCLSTGTVARTKWRESERERKREGEKARHLRETREGETETTKSVRGI